ncbi:hypothetical protein K7I13_02825 [Brucepastera parasyntrophica]|uniref:hypothetical protein n=1 Tax=Brucepastera parasyntrophica TaxID=2880008 RepID=UPI00210B8990|nr:hypothetical protein [Brucepastera parasyntrophica]ULQ60262.1 hypothetical protein K7I13_02825 [Brucepastera parasyntrophica]
MNKAKQLPVILLFLCLSLIITAEPVDIVILTDTGEKKIQTVDSEVKTWGLAQTGTTGYIIAGIENLEVLPELENLEFINLRGVKDFSFVQKVKNLKRLHISGSAINDLTFLEKLTKLEYLGLILSKESAAIKKLEVASVNFSALKKIAYIQFICSGYKNPSVPNFVNVRNKPFFDLSNNQIETLDRTDIKLLKQYSGINLKYTPVAANDVERAKLKKLPVLLDANDPVPDSALRAKQWPE